MKQLTQTNQDPFEGTILSDIYNAFLRGELSFKEAMKAFDDYDDYRKFYFARQTVAWFMDTYFKNREVATITDLEEFSRNMEEANAIDEMENFDSWVRDEGEKYLNSYGE